MLTNCESVPALDGGEHSCSDRDITLCVGTDTHRAEGAAAGPAGPDRVRLPPLTTGYAGEGHVEALVLLSTSPRETGADHLVRVAEWQTR